jgi:hypothetical protein
MKRLILEFRIMRCKVLEQIWGTIEYFCDYMIGLMSRWMNYLDRHKK